MIKSRSVFISVVCILFSMSAAGQPSAEPTRLTVVSYGGGSYQQSHQQAFIDPFCSSRKLSCASVVWGAEYGRLQLMVRSARVPWDVVEVTAAQFARGKRENLFAMLSKLPDTLEFRPLPGGPKTERWGIPNVYWSTALGYRRGAFAAEPTSWADFWNLQKFPGARALYDSPRGNLEFALLADGVSRADLYPLDVDRAFRVLDKIRPTIRVWWTDGTQPVNLLLTNQVVMSSVWTGRVFASEKARADVGYTWNGAAHELDYWVVPRGSAHVALASEFIRYASSADPMALQASLTAYGPSNVLALQRIDARQRHLLPTATENWDISFVIDSDWWSANEQRVTTRWVAWKNGAKAP